MQQVSILTVQYLPPVHPSKLTPSDQISSLIAYARDNLNVESQQMREMVDLPEEYEELSFP